MKMSRNEGTDIEVPEATLRRVTEHFQDATGTVADKLAAFPRFVPRTDLSRFLVRYELFKSILPVQGSVIECGVMNGAGLFTFANVSALLEPLNHRRQIIGFDTFEGFPAISDIDSAGGSRYFSQGGFSGADREDLLKSVAYFDEDRALAQLPRIELIKGDFLATGSEYLRRNPHLIVALLYLDFDLFEPTIEAIRLFVPRMPAGAVIAFDESNVREAPGETLALVETLGVGSLRLQRTTLGSIAWAVLAEH
jgi:Macrocin-O-methyltransferase (TylF)